MAGPRQKRSTAAEVPSPSPPLGALEDTNEYSDPENSNLHDLCMFRTNSHSHKQAPWPAPRSPAWSSSAASCGGWNGTASTGTLGPSGKLPPSTWSSARIRTIIARSNRRSKPWATTKRGSRSANMSGVTADRSPTSALTSSKRTGQLESRAPPYRRRTAPTPEPPPWATSWRSPEDLRPRSPVRCT